MTSNTLHGNNSWLIPQVFLWELASRQEIGEVVQGILSRPSVVIIPLTLYIPLSISENVSQSQNHNDDSRIMNLRDIQYTYQDSSGIAHISYPLKYEYRNPWTIVFQQEPKTLIKLQYETRRQIEVLMQHARRLKTSESIRQISRQSKQIPLSQKPLNYSDEDGNKCYIHSPKIQRWLISDIDTIHTSIRQLSIENNYCLEKYRIISSYQIDTKKDKKIYLIGINTCKFDNFRYDDISMMDLVTEENTLVELSKYRKIFIISLNAIKNCITQQ